MLVPQKADTPSTIASFSGFSTLHSAIFRKKRPKPAEAMWRTEKEKGKERGKGRKNLPGTGNPCPRAADLLFQILFHEDMHLSDRLPEDFSLTAVMGAKFQYS